MRRLFLFAILITLVITTEVFAKNNLELKVEIDSDTLYAQESLWIAVKIRNLTPAKPYKLKYLDIEDNKEGFILNIEKDGKSLPLLANGELADTTAKYKEKYKDKGKTLAKGAWKIPINIKKRFNLSELGEYKISVSFKDENGEVFKSKEMKFKLENIDETMLEVINQRLNYQTKAEEYSLLNYRVKDSNILFVRVMSPTEPGKVTLFRRLGEHFKNGPHEVAVAPNGSFAFVFETGEKIYDFMVISADGEVLKNKKRMKKKQTPTIDVELNGDFLMR